MKIFTGKEMSERIIAVLVRLQSIAELFNPINIIMGMLDHPMICR